MSVFDRLFISIIIAGISIGLVSAIIVRKSITKFEFENTFEISDSLLYDPFNNVDYSNGTFLDVSTIEGSNSIYEYIIKGKSTGKRKVLYGATLTEVEVLDVIQGNIISNTIFIYEPISTQDEIIWTFDGYNFIKGNKEYIFCLSNLKNKKEKDTYIYTTPFWGKFPLGYEDSEFKVLSADEINDKSAMTYSNMMNYEQVFDSVERMQKYFDEYSRIMDCVKTKYKSN